MKSSFQLMTFTGSNLSVTSLIFYRLAHSNDLTLILMIYQLQWRSEVLGRFQ